MQKGDIFIGNINICTKLEAKNMFTCKGTGGIHGFRGYNIESKTFIKSVPLLKIKIDGWGEGYVCIDSIDSLNSYIDVYKFILTNKIPEIILFTTPHNESEMFVDKNSLMPYYDGNLKDEKTTIKKVKKDLILDKKIPRDGDIDYGFDGITKSAICKVKRHSYRFK